MIRYSKTKGEVSLETQQEAQQIAKANQRPGQTKEQTKLIAQGIQKGIDQYKKQQKSKARELDKKLKSLPQKEVATASVEAEVVYRHHWLPWLLLGVSWLGMGGFLYLLLS
ncbi:MAG: DUF2956 domain-containing protein [Gammaproteobacteria bacterium]|nr:DUF2956 domain-containing protein [Gammaproteobacteria bacterium]